MKTFNLITLILVIVGGINWGLVGLFNYDLVSAIFGFRSGLTNLLFILVGLAALYQIVPFLKAWNIGEVRAEGVNY